MEVKITQMNGAEFLVCKDGHIYAVIRRNYDGMRYADESTVSLSARHSLCFNQIIFHDDSYNKLGSFKPAVRPASKSAGSYSKLKYEESDYYALLDDNSIIILQDDGVVATITKDSSSTSSKWSIYTDTESLIPVLSMIAVRRTVNNRKEGAWVMGFAIICILVSVGAILLWDHLFGPVI